MEWTKGINDRLKRVEFINDFSKQSGTDLMNYIKHKLEAITHGLDKYNFTTNEEGNFIFKENDGNDKIEIIYDNDTIRFYLVNEAFSELNYDGSRWYFTANNRWYYVTKNSLDNHIIHLFKSIFDSYQLEN